MKRYEALAGFAFAVIAFGAVWLGGLNQDEGWYLYAANLVGEGKVPYRDFFFTQGPLMPLMYSSFSWVWHLFGILGARILTCGIGLVGILFYAALARLMVPENRRQEAGIITFLLLGCNLYHVYFESIPKTYALASFFTSIGFYLLAFAVVRPNFRLHRGILFASGLSLAFACGVRISLGALLAVGGFGLLLACRTRRFDFLWFGLGGAIGLAAIYGPFLIDPTFREGIVLAQRYHAARGGHDVVFTIGSLSRLIRWYMPLFVILGLTVFARRFCRADGVASLPCRLAACGFAAVFAVQMLAPFPYEDYHVPVMGLLAAVASACFVGSRPRFLVDSATFDDGDRNLKVLLVLGLAFAASFSSPLLEKWSVNGQDRFWPLKKQKCELAQLRDVARMVEKLDPGGHRILTQDLYLAIETNRRVPHGLEMGPFSMLTDAEWRELLSSAPCEIAALSGYSFAIMPPSCVERPVEQQMDYWELLKKDYELVLREDAFGQNATPLLVLRRNEEGRRKAEKRLHDWFSGPREKRQRKRRGFTPCTETEDKKEALKSDG